MTAERPGGETPTPREVLTASPANAETPAVISFCPGFYIVKPHAGWADCDVCGHSGYAGDRCMQTVISDE